MLDWRVSCLVVLGVGGLAVVHCVRFLGGGAAELKPRADVWDRTREMLLALHNKAVLVTYEQQVTHTCNAHRS